MKILNKLVRIAEDVVTITCLWLCTFLIFLQVINRYLLHFEFVLGLGDLGLYCFVFLALVSVAVTTREKEHTSLDMLSRMFKNSTKKKYFYRVIIKITSLIFVGIFLPLSYKFTLSALKYPQYGTIVRWFNKSWLMETVFIMGILVFFHLLYQLLYEIKIHNNKIKEKR